MSCWNKFAEAYDFAEIIFYNVYNTLALFNMIKNNEALFNPVKLVTFRAQARPSSVKQNLI